MFRTYALIDNGYGGKCQTRVGRKVRHKASAVKQAERYAASWVTDDTSGRELPVFQRGNLNVRADAAAFVRERLSRPGDNLKGSGLSSWGDRVDHGTLSIYR